VKCRGGAVTGVTFPGEVGLQLHQKVRLRQVVEVRWPFFWRCWSGQCSKLRGLELKAGDRVVGSPVHRKSGYTEGRGEWNSVFDRHVVGATVRGFSKDISAPPSARLVGVCGVLFRGGGRRRDLQRCWGSRDAGAN